MAKIALAASLALVFLGAFSVSVAQESAVSDAGTLDEESADRLFPAKPDYSP